MSLSSVVVTHFLCPWISLFAGIIRTPQTSAQPSYESVNLSLSNVSNCVKGTVGYLKFDALVTNIEGTAEDRNKTLNAASNANESAKPLDESVCAKGCTDIDACIKAIECFRKDLANKTKNIGDCHSTDNSICCHLVPININGRKPLPTGPRLKQALENSTKELETNNGSPANVEEPGPIELNKLSASNPKLRKHKGTYSALGYKEPVVSKLSAKNRKTGKSNKTNNPESVLGIKEPGAIEAAKLSVENPKQSQDIGTKSALGIKEPGAIETAKLSVENPKQGQDIGTKSSLGIKEPGPTEVSKLAVRNPKSGQANDIESALIREPKLSKLSVKNPKPGQKIESEYAPKIKEPGPLDIKKRLVVNPKSARNLYTLGIEEPGAIAISELSIKNPKSRLAKKSQSALENKEPGAVESGQDVNGNTESDLKDEGTLETSQLGVINPRVNQEPPIESDSGIREPGEMDVPHLTMNSEPNLENDVKEPVPQNNESKNPSTSDETKADVQSKAPTDTILGKLPFHIKQSLTDLGSLNITWSVNASAPANTNASLQDLMEDALDSAHAKLPPKLKKEIPRPHLKIDNAQIYPLKNGSLAAKASGGIHAVPANLSPSSNDIDKKQIIESGRLLDNAPGTL